ncbi:hypothetical protein HD557_001932 [Nocardioides luteus]|nr:hypothetical protein [Nocardioides luteus]
MGALGAEGGVVAVARVEPGVVGEGGEDALLDVVEQLGETYGILLGVADAAGEYEEFWTGNMGS